MDSGSAKKAKAVSRFLLMSLGRIRVSEEEVELKILVWRVLTESIEVEVEDTGNLNNMALEAIELAKTYSDSSWDDSGWEYDVDL